jgi:ATP-binding cassette, subfamily C (CFTR/MRP), member 2
VKQMVFSHFKLRCNVLDVGFVGMALSYGLSLNMSFVFSIQNQCNLANLIISVERLNQYMNIESEAPEVIQESRPPLNWPVTGTVELRDLKVIFIYL